MNQDGEYRRAVPNILNSDEGLYTPSRSLYSSLLHWKAGADLLAGPDGRREFLENTIAARRGPSLERLGSRLIRPTGSRVLVAPLRIVPLPAMHLAGAGHLPIDERFCLAGGAGVEARGVGGGELAVKGGVDLPGPGHHLVTRAWSG